MKTGEIAKFLGAVIEGDADVEIIGLASLAAAEEGDITFFEGGEFQGTNASCMIVAEAFDQATKAVLIRVKSPKLAFARIAPSLKPQAADSGWHETAFVAKSAKVLAGNVGGYTYIGENSLVGSGGTLHSGVMIGANVSIGENTVIHPNCTIYDNVKIGDNCVLHAGVVVGADGFGYVRDGENGYVKFPQIGTVVIENDVEIGANTCIDRGALGETRIGEGTKIDNLVQIGHNVQIGKRVVIASQTGISGSTVIEDDCVIGGQVGFGDHARVLSGAIIGSQAGVLPGKIVRPGVWWGTPIQPLDDYKVQNAHLKSIGRLKDEVKALKKAVKELKGE